VRTDCGKYRCCNGDILENHAVIAVPRVGDGIREISVSDEPVSELRYRPKAEPWTGISILNAHGRAYGDSSTCYLRLQVSPAAFSNWTVTGFTPTTRKEYKIKTQSGSISGPLPSWWNPLKDTPTVFLYSTSFHPEFTRGQAIVSYNPTLQIMNLYLDSIE
jgi:hypothetical protein